MKYWLYWTSLVFLRSFNNRLIVKSDSLNAILWVKAKDLMPSKFQFYFNEIKELSASIQVDVLDKGSTGFRSHDYFFVLYVLKGPLFISKIFSLLIKKNPSLISNDVSALLSFSTIFHSMKELSVPITLLKSLWISVSTTLPPYDIRKLDKTMDFQLGPTFLCLDEKVFVHQPSIFKPKRFQPRLTSTERVLNRNIIRKMLEQHTLNSPYVMPWRRGSDPFYS